MTMQARLGAAAVISVLAIGGGLLFFNRGPDAGNSTQSPGTTLPTSPSASAVAVIDYSTRPGWILLEHVAANAPDGSGPASGPDGRSLWLIHADGTGLHELLPGQPVDGKTNPVWSRDGTHIAFESVDPRRVVYETDVAGKALYEVYSCSGVVDVEYSGEWYGCIEGSPAYSPDGNVLATVHLFEGRAAQQVIYRQQRWGSEHRVGVEVPATNEPCLRSGSSFHLGIDLFVEADSTASIGGLSWSPDGIRIAFYRVAKDAHGKPLASELWIVTADGTDAHAIPLPEGLRAGDPDWSPDASSIVFSSDPIHDWNDAGISGEPDVYTVRPDGTDLRRLTRDHNSGSPSWTSDGKILFFHLGSMWLMDADGSNPAPIFPDGPELWGEATGWSSYAYWQPMR